MTDIVLTADRTLMTDYNGFTPLGHVTCLPNRLVPEIVLKFLLPKLSKGEATYALRRVECSLLADGYDVKVLPPQDIHQIKKLKPKIVGLSTVDPLTRKPHPWTLTNIFGGGTSVIQREFLALLEKLNKIRMKHHFDIVIGGPGATEFETIKEYNDLFDTAIIGPGEGAHEIFEKALNNEPLPRLFYAQNPNVDNLPLIQGPARNGHVQITQGCPRGCEFCIPTLLEWKSFPVARILQEIETTLKKGIQQVSLITEDFFLYGSKEVEVNHNAIVDLMHSVTQLTQKYSVSRINFSNISIASTIKGKKTCEQVSDILGLTEEYPVDTIVGVETGSERLIKKYMERKTKPYNPDNWRELVKEGIDILNDNHWHPLCNFITGLPGENEDDVIKTLDLVDDLMSNTVFYYVFYFAPLEGSKLETSSFFSFDDISERRWELFIKCWRKTIQTLQADISKMIDRKILGYAIIKILNEFEKDLIKFKHDPYAFRDAYAFVNFKGLHVFRFLCDRYFFKR
jgi:radical SAM superfamily enzyme YgiQ (UPF0313 family)